MDAGVHHGKLEPSPNSDGTTIIILGPSGQVQMGTGIGRPGDSIDTPFVPDASPPDIDQGPDRDQPSDASSPPTPITPLTGTLTPTETSAPEMITDTPAIKSITSETPDRSTETPSASTSKSLSQSSDALPSVSPSSASTTRSSLTSSDSASLTLLVSSTTAATRSSSILSTPSSSSTSSTATISGRSDHPSSTSHSRTSLLLSSGTASRASATAAYRPLSQNSQELNAHSPSFYVAVSVGAVAGAAIAVALIAWCIRFLTKARRRRRGRHTTVPWGNPGNDSANRMEGGQVEYGDFSSVGASIGSKPTHTTDRLVLGNADFGDIRCGRFDGNGNPLRDHPIIPGRTLPVDYAFDEVDLGPRPRPNHNLRYLPSHLVDEDLAARARLETCPIHSPGPPLSLRSGVFAERGPSPGMASEKSPRRTSSAQGSYEQKLAFGEDPAAPPRSPAERLRHIGRSPIATPRDRPDQLSKSDEAQKDNADAWAASLKNSLVNAFNAVAVNISGAPRMGEKNDGPTRRFTRQSVRDVQWDSKESAPARRASISSKDSKPWTLEETREGAGVVHLHIDDPREYRARAPTVSANPNIRRQAQELFHGGISRESSIYSTLSAYPEWRERPSRHGSINPSLHSARKFRSLRVANPTRESRQSTLDSVVIRPHPISRLASTASSATDIHGGRSLDVDIAASRALRDRQKRALNASQ